MEATKVNTIYGIDRLRQLSLSITLQTSEKEEGFSGGDRYELEREMAPLQSFNESVGCQGKARVVKVTITGNYFSISLPPVSLCMRNSKQVR